MTLILVQPGTMQSIGPTSVTAEDIAQMPPEGYFATRQFASASTREASIEVTTTQGDKVTLNWQSSSIDFGYLRPVGTVVPGLIDEEASSETISVRVEGDLSQDEKEALAGLQKELSGIMSNGQETDTDVQSLLSGYETLSQLTIETSATTINTLADEMTLVPDPVSKSQDREQSFFPQIGQTDLAEILQSWLSSSDPGNLINILT
ncbi:hypothetical protein [Desulfobacter curvatus]|uniref:hypothetical protein n=1 Tax=Desulfobacter curvatus TaxID=2290 RepID=UPI00038118B2|nr:hypothetical protein [Desulfobacter curvatus]